MTEQTDQVPGGEGEGEPGRDQPAADPSRAPQRTDRDEVDGDRIWSTARRFAERGLPVMPVDPASKAPMTRRGLPDATTDARQLGRWWRDLGDRAGLAVPTGAVSGFDALDVDVQHGGDKTLQSLLNAHGNLPPTASQQTQSGGRHYLFRHDPGLSLVNRSGGKQTPGIDCRSNGGYIIVPPTPGYRWLDRAQGMRGLAPWPDWLAGNFRRREIDREQLPFDTTNMLEHELQGITRHAYGIFHGAARDIQQAAPGTQEMTLNDRSLRLGRVAASGLIEEDEVLTAAIEAGRIMGRNSDPNKKPWTDKEIDYKVRRAFRQGYAMGPPADLRWDRPDRRRQIRDRQQKQERTRS